MNISGIDQRKKVFEEITFCLPENEAAAYLWLGEKVKDAEPVLIFDRGKDNIKAYMLIKTGSGLEIKEDDDLHITFYNVFNNSKQIYTEKLGENIFPCETAEHVTYLKTGMLEQGYYLIISDIRRNNASLLAGRVGTDDFYIRKPGENDTCTVLSLRLGMAVWSRDILNGGIMGQTKIALPHVYNPLVKETYSDFLRLYALSKIKQAEGYEAGLMGLSLAAEAFRRSGDRERQEFAEWLIKDSVDYMLGKMQISGGAVCAYIDEYGETVEKTSAPYSCGPFDSDSIGEFLRGIVYAILYYKKIPGSEEYVKKLNAACRKSADYLIKYAIKELQGINSVLCHFVYTGELDEIPERSLYHQEGRQCDVYVGRVLSGLSYYAYAMQLLGDKVPDEWWNVLDNTVKWCSRKMLENGWFDWQCGDVVENGCHTFLGNIYIGEGLFGVYLANRAAGRLESAESALEAAKKAYYYLTDSCTIRGIRFGDYFGATDMWVASYMYWLFTEYLCAVGNDEKLKDWLNMIDNVYEKHHGWRDFLDRPEKNGDLDEMLNHPRNNNDYCYRSNRNGMLTLAVLGYLGLNYNCSCIDILCILN